MESWASLGLESWASLETFLWKQPQSLPMIQAARTCEDLGVVGDLGDLDDLGDLGVVGEALDSWICFHPFR